MEELRSSPTSKGKMLYNYRYDLEAVVPVCNLPTVAVPVSNALTAADLVLEGLSGKSSNISSMPFGTASVFSPTVMYKTLFLVTCVRSPSCLDSTVPLPPNRSSDGLHEPVCAGHCLTSPAREDATSQAQVCEGDPSNGFWR